MHTKKDIVLFSLLLIVIYAIPGCKNSGFSQRADSLFLVIEDQEIFYELKSPEEKLYLPYVLQEISGLSWKYDSTLLAVDDETGKVFEYGMEEQDIVHSIHFYRGDDFEGVELVGSDIYILRSDGDLFKVDYTSSKKTTAWKIETALGKMNDTEGLGYDPISNNLIIACKEKGGLDDEKIKGRAFYSFDLSSNKLDENPLFTIRKKDLDAFWEANKGFDYDEDRIKFKPSAIAFHPISKNYYILASVGKMILVVDRKGIIKATYPIYPRILGQPEGLAFSKNGDMYISSEGEGDRGYIVRFKMKTR
ncbi:MAG: SdiA-regulated domain-containing protein [Bacteroidota bacterium]